jgi:hypothetical protein
MSWWLNAKPGDRVVCVGWDDRDGPKNFLVAKGMKVPSKGSVYSIRCVGPTIGCSKRFALRLREIVNPPLIIEGVDIGEVCWRVEWFRPVVNRATDISIFTSMLNGQPTRVDA